MSLDPVQLKEAFANIIINPCEAMDHGGRITITESAIEAIKAGAFDYLLKAFDIPEMLAMIIQAVDAGYCMRAPVEVDAAPKTFRAYRNAKFGHYRTGLATGYAEIFHIHFPTRLDYFRLKKPTWIGTGYLRLEKNIKKEFDFYLVLLSRWALWIYSFPCQYLLGIAAVSGVNNGLGMSIRTRCLRPALLKTAVILG